MRSIFLNVPAFLGRIHSTTRIAFWPDEPPDLEFDEAKLIEIDLARCPQAAASGEIRWDEVQVDDCIPGPSGNLIGTTLGASWPELQIMGSVGLEQRTWQRLPSAVRPPCPPAGAAGRDYETLADKPKTPKYLGE
jgi:hypothetical protein